MVRSSEMSAIWKQQRWTVVQKSHSYGKLNVVILQPKGYFWPWLNTKS